MDNYIIDTHCHLFKEYYDNIDEVIKNCQLQNIKYMIVSGVNKDSNTEMLDLASQYECIYCTLGIHPEYASKYNEADLQDLENKLSNSKCLGIGEIGLDYHYDDVNKDMQIILFEKQLELAQKYNLPVVIHSRNATEDTLKILKKYDVKGIIHCFSGSYEVAKQYVEMGFLLGIGGVVTFNNSKIKEVVKKIGIQNIVLETDSPYLSPHPNRGQKNNPAYTNLVVGFLSEYLEIPAGQIINITTQNALAIFDKICR